MSGLIIDAEKCTKCNVCATVCPLKIIIPSDGESLPAVNPEMKAWCMHCGHCESFCSFQALTLDYLTSQKEKRHPVLPDKEDLSLYLKNRRSIRHFEDQPVDKEIINEMIDTAKYSASGGNSQSVSWMIINNKEKMKEIAKLTIDWMKTIVGTDHPMAKYLMGVVTMWDNGVDFITHNAPQLIIATIPNNHMQDRTDGIIALTHLDILAPAFGVGICWAGFIMMAHMSYPPLQEYLSIPKGLIMAYPLLAGYPKFKPSVIPRRNPVKLSWID